MSDSPDPQLDQQKVARGREGLGRARIDHYFLVTQLNWLKECEALQASLSKNGQFGGSAGYFKALDLLHRIAGEQIDMMLGELAKAIRTRGKLWDRLHDYASEKAETSFSDAASKADKLMVRAASYAAEGEERVQRTRNHIGAQIALHQEGWTAPLPDTLEQRYPILTKVGLLVLGALLGFALSIIATSFTQTPSKESSAIETSETPRTETGAKLEKPRVPEAVGGSGNEANDQAQMLDRNTAPKVQSPKRVRR